MKRIIILLLCAAPLWAYSQLNDTIWLKNGELIRCQITEINNIWIIYDKYSGNTIVSASSAISKVKKYVYGNVLHTVVITTPQPDSIVLLNNGMVIRDTTAYLLSKIDFLSAELDKSYKRQRIAGLYLDKAGSLFYSGLALSIISTGATFGGFYSDLSGRGNPQLLYGIGIGTGLLSYICYIIAPGHVKRAGKELLR